MIPLLWFKVAAASFLLIAGLIAARTMLKLMGTPGPPAAAPPREAGTTVDPSLLRKRHKTAGRAFGFALAALAAAGLFYWGRTGDAVPDRAILHIYFAMSLAALYLLKLAIARRYRQYLRLAAPLGMTLATLMLVVYTGSAGYYLLRTALRTAAPSQETILGQAGPDSKRGRLVFDELCSDCHYADREDRRVGPGLKGILQRPALPASGRPATVENVRLQLRTPFRNMPAFPGLAESDLLDLIDYLRTL